jgi:hypothetical protein
MKQIIVILTIVVYYSYPVFAQSVGISDQSDQSINASAVLDVQSSSKGLLTPRMDSTSRKSISSPAEGLLVYDTSTKSFWFYGKKDDKTTGSWREVQNGSISAKDKVTIEDDGTLRFDNAATVYGDLIVSPDATSKGPNSPALGFSPTALFKNDGSSSVGVLLWVFSPTTEQDLYITVQMPHGYKEGTDIYPHVHWTTKTGTPSGTDVVWGLEYTWVNLGGNFANTSTLTANSVIASVGTPSGTGQHLITSLGTMSGTGKKISSIIVCRLFRKAADSNDTFVNETGLLSMDFHYEIDMIGSRTLYVK